MSRSRPKVVAETIGCGVQRSHARKVPQNISRNYGDSRITVTVYLIAPKHRRLVHCLFSRRPCERVWSREIGELVGWVEHLRNPSAAAPLSEKSFWSSLDVMGIASLHPSYMTTRRANQMRNPFKTPRCGPMRSRSYEGRPGGDAGFGKRMAASSGIRCSGRWADGIGRVAGSTITFAPIFTRS
jgi:hypothetical protein